ncbi:hypothetical protein E2P81_ATG06952 [Venturia nashicola]|uniref:Uncharacterized protein n=1 Tax=Venturia nashicola TaxID=86259 RepID=A0A4Z1NV86_9PEZI|nr:hypothetical protein E6O75_ATG07122 [Venturia nashicola]TLD30299.1 hypothetical protein E2P81_ATG06952 [Venturia nashicola]
MLAFFRARRLFRAPIKIHRRHRPPPPLQQYKVSVGPSRRTPSGTRAECFRLPQARDANGWRLHLAQNGMAWKIQTTDMPMLGRTHVRPLIRAQDRPPLTPWPEQSVAAGTYPFAPTMHGRRLASRPANPREITYPWMTAKSGRSEGSKSNTGVYCRHFAFSSSGHITDHGPTSSTALINFL